MLPTTRAVQNAVMLAIVLLGILSTAMIVVAVAAGLVLFVATILGANVSSLFGFVVTLAVIAGLAVVAVSLGSRYAVNRWI